MSERTTMNGKPVFTVPNKTVINFESGFKEKLLCDGPTFTAGTACPFDCAFCYVEAQMNKQRPWLYEHGLPRGFAWNDVVIRRQNAVEIARKQLLAHPEAERMERKVIYGSPLTDVAANMDLVRETVEICKVILELTNWDIRLLSKSNLLPKVGQMLWDWELKRGHKMLSEHRIPEPQGTFKNRVIYGVSTGTLNNDLAAAFEQGTPKVSKRIESLHWLQDNGFRTFGMICPSLPTWIPGSSSRHAYALASQDMAKAIRVDHCEHVWAEVINVRGKSFERVEKALLDAGFGSIAAEIRRISCDQQEWENYARLTFEGHQSTIPVSKLRFLQYVNAAHFDWWKVEEPFGAVLLGSAVAR